MVEYSLSVVNATSFLCFSSATDHLLSAMPHLSIKARYHIILLFLYWWNAPFFNSRKIKRRRIQNQLEVLFHIISVSNNNTFNITATIGKEICHHAPSL